MSVIPMSKKYRRKALALIVVVYILAALGTLVFALAYRSQIGLCQAQLLMDRIQQDEIALAVCTQACRLLALDAPNVDSQEDIWSGWHALEMPLESVGRKLSGQVWWCLMDESARINVNLAPWDVLSRIDGVDQAVVASILDWIDEDNTPNPDGVENEYYASLFPSYACRNGPLESLEELAFIKGITAEIYFGTQQTEPLEDLKDLALEQDRKTEEEEGAAGLSELLTIYGDGKINLNTAHPCVLKALPFLSEAAVDEILSKQQPNARKFTTLEDIETNDTFSTTDKIVLLQVAKFNSSFFQLQIKIQLERMSSIFEYTAFLERDETEVRVLSWQQKLPYRSSNQGGTTDTDLTVEFMD
ncbi:MAG: general secretion pathway protein GspK [Planctomycetes bacterium]|nr:general secretion pathway protein GspK [Planctomycetota bacterium]